MISLIVSVATNGVIGRSNLLPWHNPEDMSYFKKMTIGKSVIMGRKTYQSIGKPLQGRINIVLTNNINWTSTGIHIAHSLQQALILSENLNCNNTEIMIIGGSELFLKTLPDADRLYITEIHRDYVGDSFFPHPNPALWYEISREDHIGDPSFSFVTMERRFGI
ncbi:MAG: dihydrofolate reductase [Rhodospirillaceae bacterium]|jgi:dihydrofolate reductase|nr:dihydrofolate reductase [Rhodospirillaceae bacterium]